MTILLSVISSVVLLSLIAMTVMFVRVYGKLSACEKENIFLNNTNAQFRETISKSENDMLSMLAIREEQFARIAALESENRVLAERLEAQKEQFDVTLEQMRSEFKAIAGEALEKNSEMLSRQSQEKLSNILTPFNNDLKQFREKVESYYGEESKQRFSLQENIKSLVEANQNITREAVNLTNAIAGTNNNKFQGDWGETILEQILENSGLIEGEQWEHQVTLRDEKGGVAINDETQRAMKPDVIVHFPGKRDIIIDSKVSLKAYMAYLAAEDDVARSIAVKEHVASVRRHIDELAGKRYDKYNINSLDYVMLFIPNEPSYFMAMEADNALWNYAYKKGIVLISPSNLISTLFVVNSLWTRERQQRDVQKIVDTANSLYDKFVNFTENFRKIDTSLEKAHEAYCDAFKQLKSGNGSIAKKLDDLKQLGLLTTSKQIHDNFIEDK
ncbi:MAG: DNA recombination protein RmuC [Bacteroidaceae bacterium]|nr:DNA recombination protein RmuC [Bacteroidaceae bacterium]